MVSSAEGVPCAPLDSAAGAEGAEELLGCAYVPLVRNFAPLMSARKFLPDPAAHLLKMP